MSQFIQACSTRHTDHFYVDVLLSVKRREGCLNVVQETSGGFLTNTGVVVFIIINVRLFEFES